MEADFSGWATKAGIKCSDGRTIMPDAFAHQNQTKVPLVWAHRHDEPVNVLGHALLENRPEGVYAYGFFNETSQGANGRALVAHGDIGSLSIYANQLEHQGRNVTHGDIREVSLVLAGANPGAVIDNVYIRHGDDVTELEDEAIIYSGEEFLQHDNEGDTMGDIAKPEVVEHADTAVSEDVSVQTAFDELTDTQKEFVLALLAEAVEAALAEDSSDKTDDEDSSDETVEHSSILEGDEFLAHLDTKIQEGINTAMTRNLFENKDGEAVKGSTLSHEALKNIVTDGGRLGSLKESFLAHAGEYGIDDIEFLFPDAKTLSSTPDYISRRMEWVSKVLGGVSHSPFSRVKSIVADITADEARAKGYVKGNLKKDEVIKLLKRVTTPKTIYKKQKLDRDDILDITDLDVVVWLKSEMRLMLDEEIAAAILVGDGRESDDEDKIDEDHLRPIAYDVDMYNTTVNLDGTPTPAETVEAIIRAGAELKGSGNPSYYTTQGKLTDILLDKDTLGRRYYNNAADLAAALGVKEIVVVEAMSRAADVVGILVNLTDYRVGADKGGEINFFDDFDIDYNQQKYLIETRLSGALTKPKSAVTIKANPGTIVVPPAPTFVSGTGVVTIPTATGVVYKNDETGATLTAGAQTALVSGDTLEVQAVPAAGYSFAHGGDYDWAFTRP